MIVRIVPKRSATSDLRRLAAYVLAEKSNDPERLVAAWANETGCDEDLDLAVKDIALKQARNTRSKADKTMHLLVSFPADEKTLSIDELKTIETRLLACLGLEEHGRITAVHGDTANRHMHLVINLVDDRGRMAHLSFPQKKLATERERIMKEMDLRPLPQRENSTPSNDARRIDAQGIDSFASWVKREALPQILTSLAASKPSWQALHGALAASDLELRQHGAGIVISHRSAKLFVPASSIHRNLSKTSLEKRLGQFEAPEIQGGGVPPERSYKKASSAALFAEYQELRNTLSGNRLERREELKRDLAKDRHILTTRGREAKARIRALRLGTEKMRQYLALADFNLAKERQRLSDSFNFKFKEVTASTTPPTWPVFLQVKANEGNIDAIQALKKRAPKVESSTGATKNEIIHSSQKPTILTDFRFTVSQNGEITYNNGTEQFKDGGRSLIFPTSTSDETLKTALQLAVSKFGNKLVINGSKDFQDRCQKLAKSLKIKISEKQTGR